MPKLNIEELFVAHPAGTNGKYAQKLRRRLGLMLEMAESLFERRDCSYTILALNSRTMIPKSGIRRSLKARKS